jgi:hypothetical protein
MAVPVITKETAVSIGVAAIYVGPLSLAIAIVAWLVSHPL